MQVSLNTLTALVAAGNQEAQAVIQEWLGSIYAYDSKVFYCRKTDTLSVIPRHPHSTWVEEQNVSERKTLRP